VAGGPHQTTEELNRPRRRHLALGLLSGVVPSGLLFGYSLGTVTASAPLRIVCRVAWEKARVARARPFTRGEFGAEALPEKKYRMVWENIGRRPYPPETRMARGVSLVPEQHAARELAVAARAAGLLGSTPRAWAAPRPLAPAEKESAATE
jgi:hypothetical protein